LQVAETQEHAVRIRRAGEADAAEIASLLYESFVQYKPLYTEAAFDATAPAPHAIIDRMKEGPTWVATRNEEIVGTASILLTDKGVYIRGMAVLPAARGHGVGRRLLEHLEAFAVAQRAPRLFLSTTPFLTEAINLYAHYGFRRIDHGPFDLFGTPLFTMEKRL
jgi:N-acetylglutamate synthase-like GNAT family acetyltransferase